MKTFITEQQLALYKYQPQSRYYNYPMADIVLSEYKCFMKQVNNRCDDVLALFEHFLHKRISKNTWEYCFPDNSSLTIIELGSINNEKEYSFNIYRSGICNATNGIFE